jgi:DNA-binding XRE family transcriptional regulator
MPTRCTNCGGTEFTESEERRTRHVAGYDAAGEVPVTTCDTCGERFYALGALASFDSAVAAGLAEAGASSGEALKFMRKTMGLTAAELGKLLNLTPESISHVETGKRDADRRTVALVSAMALENLRGAKTTIERLRALDRKEKRRHGMRSVGGKRRLDVTSLMASSRD